MAKANYGGGVLDIRGSIGGQTHSRNRGGAYIRQKVSPVQPISDFSSNARQAWKIGSTTWATALTDSERAGWIAFAATHPVIDVFGNSIILSGVSMFKQLNQRLQQLGFSQIADAPASISVDPPGDINPVVSVNGVGSMSLFVNPTLTGITPPIIAFCWATKVIAPGRVPVKNDYRLLNTFIGDTPNDTFDWGGNYLARFGTPFAYTPNVGDRIGILYMYLDTNTGAISTRSAALVTAVGVPGPIINLDGYQLQDAGGGDVTPMIFTDAPHGLNPGDTVVVTGTSEALVDGTRTVAGVDGPSIFHWADVTGTPGAFTPTGGATMQRTA